MSEKTLNQQLPAYLSEICFQKALEKARQTSNVKLGNWQWKLANVSGVNNCSNVFHVKGNFRILPTDNAQDLPTPTEKQMFNFFIKDVFMEVADSGTNELIMLEKILPEMLRILESTQTQKISQTSNKLAASCFWSQSNKEHEFYILENLDDLGYILGNRYDGLSVQEAKLVMEKLAKFHAASMVYAEKFPYIIAKLLPTQFAASSSAADPINAALNKKSMECAIEILEMPDDDEIVGKMKKLIIEFDEKIKTIVKPTKSAFNVLNHGDLWVNNILFKGNQTRDDVIFVDFQNVFWGSPACDLYYFLYTSLPLNILQTQRFKLLNHYYKTLKLILVSLRYQKVPKLSDLLNELRRCALIGYYVVICEFPFSVMSKEAAEGFTMKKYLESETRWISIFKTPKVFQFIWDAVLHFEEIGLFDE